MQIKHHKEISEIASLFDSKDGVKLAAFDSLEFKGSNWQVWNGMASPGGISEGSQ